MNRARLPLIVFLGFGLGSPLRRDERRFPKAAADHAGKFGVVDIARTAFALTTLAWISTMVLAEIHRLLRGEPLDWSLVAVFPATPNELLTLPIMAAFVLLDHLAKAGAGAPWRVLPTRCRYDLFFVLADATGAMRAFGIAFSFGLGVWVINSLPGEPISRVAGTLPFAAEILAAFAAGSFCGYWGHRLMHTRLLWPLHALHHSAKELTPLTDSRQHPLDDVIKGLPVGFGFALIGFDPDAALAAALLGRLQAAFIHSSLPFPLWLERWLVCGPALHRVHHATAAEHHHRNFAALVLWDRLFGTFSLPPDARTLRVGVDGSAYDGQRPLHDIIAGYRIWLAHLPALVSRRA